jgi:hypothetical protein
MRCIVKGGKHKRHMSRGTTRTMPTADSSHDDNRCTLWQHANDIIENVEDSVLDAVPFFYYFM